MSAYSLLLRHPDLFTSRTLFVTGQAPLEGDWLSACKPHSCRIRTWNWIAHTSAASLGTDACLFGIPETTDVDGIDTVVLLWPKANEQALALLQWLSAQPDAASRRYFAVAANDAGGKSIGKRALPLCQSVTKIDTARHSTLWQLQLTATNGFNWLQQAQSFHWQQNAYLTLPGVFNHGKLDQGTALLLEHLPVPNHGRVLDLGCGSGIIGLSLKARQAALEVYLTDIDAFALRSSELNAMRLGLSVNIKASDGLAQVDGRFDYVFSNPPFHQGKDTDYRFAQHLFANAQRHLTRQGQLWLVANRHLPYEEWAAEHFAQVDIVAQGHGFKVLLAQAH